MTRRSRHFPFQLIALGCAAAFAGIHWFLTHDRITVCYQVATPDRGITRLYWDLGDGFDESKSLAHHTPAGIDTNVCFNDPRLRHVQRIRVDPMEQAGRFRLGPITIDPLDEFVPWHQVRSGLRAEQADAHNQVTRINAAGRGTALGHDPFLIWSVQGRMAAGKSLVAVNAMVVYVVVLAGLYLSAREARDAYGAVKATPALLLYPLFALFALLAASYIDVARYSRYVIYITVMLYLLFAGLINKDDRFSMTARYSVPLLAIIFVIAFDVAYRLGMTGQPLFTPISNDAYHWRITRTTGDNFQNASLKYYEDFAEIEKIIVPHSLFLADVATSYYVVSALDLYAANTHPHHGRQYGGYRAILRALCGENNKISQTQVKGALEKREADNVARGRLVLRYMFVNKDTVNKNVRGHCITRQHPMVERILESMAEKIYTGKYLDVYEFPDFRERLAHAKNAERRTCARTAPTVRGSRPPVFTYGACRPDSRRRRG